MMKKFLNFAILTLVFAFICCNFAFFNKTVCFALSQKELSSAKSMAVIEKTSGRVLYSKNANQKLPMASTTKIITAIYVIEHTDDLDKVCTIPKEAVGIEGTSVGLKEGEHLSIRELLYALMLRSGNDSAVALAILTEGSEENFVEKVNEFLKDNGFDNTHISNPHGLPCENHYTTAEDLAKITAYALKNPTFQEIVSTKSVQISNELKSNYNRTLINKNKMLKNFEFADGVKTGYTRKAGRCFVGSATKDGMQVICVLLNCNPMFEECEQLLKKAFDEYKLYKLAEKGNELKKIKIENSKEQEMTILAGKDFYYPLRQDELNNIQVSINLPDSVKAPIKVGDLMGTMEIKLQNQLIFLDKIYSIIDVEANDFGSNINKIVEKM